MVRGYLTFENRDKCFEDQNKRYAGQRILIVVEDTSRLDSSAIQVAQTVATLPEGFDFEHDVLPFKIDVSDNSATLTIRAHMPVHSGSDIRLGDMITTEAIPVHQNKNISMTLHRVV